MNSNPQPAIKTLEQYLREFQVINRIVTALASAKDTDDIYSIILSSLISHQGLLFTRSFLFTFDARFNTFTGYLALGPSSQEESAEYLSDLQKEEEALSALLRSHPVSPASEEVELWESCLSGLQVTGLWISAVQRLTPTNAMTIALKRLSFSGFSGRTEEKFLHDACSTDRPRVHEKSRETDKIPSGLARILDERFVTIPLRSKTRIHAVVIADRRFSDIPVTSADLHHLQWFANQASMALENASLYKDLENAYKDLKQMDILKSNFLSTVSHELRTPLTTIHGFSELLAEGRVGELTERQHNLISRVAKNSKHLINMINDIIEVAEIQAHGMGDIKVRPVDPLPILMTAISHVRERKDNKQVNIEPVIENSPPMILSEEHCLERILYHLLDNAVKFSEDEGLVTVRFEEEDGDLRIVVKDQGIGVDEAQLRRIYEDFYQADNKLNRPFEGLGLGLTITRLLLTATGGRIMVESVPNQGSAFTIVYPVSQ